VDLDDFRWLLGADGQDLLFRSQAMVESGVPPLKAGERLRAAYDASRVAAALSQVDLRTRAVAKFGDLAALMYFTRDGLEQATRLQVARAGLAEISEKNSVPVENILSPDLVRRIMWSPPEPREAASVGEALRAGGAREWQIGLTLAVLADAVTKA